MNCSRPKQKGWVNSIKITFFTARNRTRSVNPFDCCSLAFACATCATHLILFHSSFICQSPAPRPPAPLLYILFCILYFVFCAHFPLAVDNPSQDLPRHRTLVAAPARIGRPGQEAKPATLWAHVPGHKRGLPEPPRSHTERKGWALAGREKSRERARLTRCFLHIY